MTSSRNTLIAFLLNLVFAIIEFIFGILFNSSAILADSIHDFGDATAIGISAFLEKFSNREADQKFSLGYKRFSLTGALITAIILISGSTWVVIENIPKLFHPEPVNQDGMLILGIIAILVNLTASYVVHSGKSKNEDILSLHFLEDTLGWLAVIVVALILRFTDWYFLDPLLSLIIAAFILSKALPRLWSILKIFLDAVPDEIDLEHLQTALSQLDNIVSINQVTVWSMDGLENLAIVHACLKDPNKVSQSKASIRDYFEQLGITEVNIEIDQDLYEHDCHKRK